MENPDHNEYSWRPAIRDYSFWQERSPLRSVVDDQVLPTQADSVIVGAGYSGLSVALHLARAGRDVVVLEKDRPGEHASTLNFGACGRTIRHKFTKVASDYGLETAIRIFREAKAWLDYTVDFIDREQIDCGFTQAGRVYGAHTPEAFMAMARDLEYQQQHMPVDSVMISRLEQKNEVCSDDFFGVQLLNDVGHLDPGRYHAGLLQRALDSGVRVYSGCRADAFECGREGYGVRTNHGHIRSKELILCTNAQTLGEDPLLKKFRRRLIPVHCWSVVTEPLDDQIIRQALPSERMQLETILLYTAVRVIDPDRRILVCAQHLYDHENVQTAAAAGLDQAAERMPVLKDVRADYCWYGQFAMTFDWLPHLGTDPTTGIHYLIGLVGTGVPASGYLGWKLANRILGNSEGETVFADRPFPARPFYNGNPAWVLPAVREYYRFRDLRAWKKALKKDPYSR